MTAQARRAAAMAGWYPRYRKALTLGNLPETARDRIRAAIVDGGATGLR
jgi:hypothetical protein